MNSKPGKFDKDQLYAVLTKHIYKADYASAVRYLKKQRKVFPNNFYIETHLATLPYENAFYLPLKQKEKAFAKAADNLKPYLKKLRGIPEQNRVRTRNEYYWFSGQHLKQYKLGVEGVNKGNFRSYYSQGVGAANHAYKLGLSGKQKLTLKWAKIAESAWEKYFLKVNKKYFDPWLWYALSLGLQGKNQSMEKALKIAAKLASISYKKDRNIIKIRQMVLQVRNIKL